MVMFALEDKIWERGWWWIFFLVSKDPSEEFAMELEANRPRFTMEELRQVLWERNDLKTKLMEVEEAITIIQRTVITLIHSLIDFHFSRLFPRENESESNADVEGPIPLEPDEKLYGSKTQWFQNSTSVSTSPSRISIVIFVFIVTEIHSSCPYLPVVFFSAWKSVYSFPPLLALQSRHFGKNAHYAFLPFSLFCMTTKKKHIDVRFLHVSFLQILLPYPQTSSRHVRKSNLD